MERVQQSDDFAQITQNAGTLPFYARYVSANAAVSTLADPRLIALIEFSSDKQQQINHKNSRYIHVNLEQLSEPGLVEAWFCDDPVKSGNDNGLHYSYTDEFIFGHLQLNESDFTDLQSASYGAYQRIFQFLKQQGFPCMLRAWNYFPGITTVNKTSAHAPDLYPAGTTMERYHAYCVGRHQALKPYIDCNQDLPAGSALGTQTSDIIIYFIAAKTPGFQIENPRQISAFDYPPQYSPLSPSFSRAISKQWKNEQHLYISGTASIVGHETLHHDDVSKQLEETLQNLRALWENFPQEHNLAINSLAELSLIRVYIRHEKDFALIKKQLEEAIGKTVPILYLKGDICRTELLLEIEACYFSNA